MIKHDLLVSAKLHQIALVLTSVCFSVLTLTQQEELIGWIANEIKVVVRVKNKLHASGDEIRYKHYRNKICTLLRVRKRK